MDAETISQYVLPTGKVIARLGRDKDGFFFVEALGDTQHFMRIEQARRHYKSCCLHLESERD